MPRFTRRQRQKITLRIFLTFLVIISIYEIFAFANKVYKEYQINLQIDEAIAQKNFLIQDNIDKQNEILYYESDQYKEKIAKSSLNLHKPGEIVINIKDNEGNFLGDERESANADFSKLPNYKKWFIYFFGIRK